MCKGNQEPTLRANEERPDCVVLPACDTNPGMAVGECYAPGSLAQMRLRQDDNADAGAPIVSAKSEASDIEVITPLPICNGSNGVVKVDCRKPNPKTGALAQVRHHHHHHHRHEEDGASDYSTSGDEGEKITPLAPCTGAKGENAGVDCRKGKALPGCKDNVLPTVGESEVANCRVLPLCSAPGSGPCFAAAPGSLAQRFQNLPIIDTTSLPVCNGSNGTPNIDCRPSIA